MPAEDDDYCQQDLEELRSRYPDDRFISYCLPPGKRPGRIKVRYIIRVASGDQAKHIDARQAKAIMDVPRWLHDHPEQHEQIKADREATADDASK